MNTPNDITLNWGQALEISKDETHKNKNEHFKKHKFPVIQDSKHKLEMGWEWKKDSHNSLGVTEK